ncbi:DUF423 domain-containing protein [Sandaracinobacter sp. RS1-74]|uniref:DUF423 domain-containing protein n=1 Tax=Sandaracinobacteroides sayramensis TaxID=2913411 RepID=UPI001EDC92EB|nr:DUF423 domain-containing protein [Sandaracinobacteroides sayramensis]MCG2840815.1 DUF423 domain-containing protein [Sandaracinobacteroides sayramensis]
MANQRILPALAALGGFLAVTIGSFGAHAIQDPQAREWIATAAQFQLPHSAAVFALLAWRPHAGAVRLSAWLLALGSLAFAGSLQALGLGAPRAVAMLAPVGGTVMAAGWAILAIAALSGAARIRR